MIRSVSTGGTTPPTEFAAAADAATAQASQQPSLADAVAAHGHDALTKLSELLGAPTHKLGFYAGSGGAGGGATTAKPSKADPLVGADVPGQKGVVIERSLGDPSGYNTRNHALAWARAVGSDKAMVVLGSDKRWHAVLTNKVGQNGNGGTGKVVQAIQVGKVDPAVYERLKKEAMAGTDPDKWKDFASYALGVPRDEINVVTRSDQEPSRTMININLTRDFDAEGKTAGFDPAKPPWLQLGPSAFDRPANACSTLAHEEVHADHHALAIPMYKEYEKFKAAHPGNKDDFRLWAAKDANKAKTLDAWRKADIVAGLVDLKAQAHAATELEAHIEAAKVSFASGDLEQASRDLYKVARREVMPLEQTKAISVAVLKELRDSLGADALKVFDEVAKKANSISVLHDKSLQPH